MRTKVALGTDAVPTQDVSVKVAGLWKMIRGPRHLLFAADPPIASRNHSRRIRHVRTLPITLPPEAIRELFQTHGELPNWPAYYNAAPKTALPVVRQAKDGGRELVLMQWGLIPWFSKDGKLSYSTINAR
jgi:hypothetical protein